MSFFKNHSGWPLVPLKSVATLKRGYDLPVDARTEGSVPIYAANGRSGAHNKVKIKGPGVITGRSGTIGKVHYCEGDFWPLNTALYVMDFHGNHPRWVYYMLSSFKLERFSEGAGVPTLNRNLVHDELIPVPPLPEQKRIAAILDKADAIRRKRQQAIQLADDFIRALFLTLFGDPVTNPKGWPLKRFGEIGKWSSGGTPSRTVSDFFKGDINWYSAGELNSRYLDGSVEKISESALKNSAAKIFKKDSLLVGMYDTAALKISILTHDSSCNQACANVECNELSNVDWLYSYIDCSRDSYLSRRRGVRQKNLNLGMIRDFLLPLPPRDLQDEFVKFVSAVFDIKKRQELSGCLPVFESLSLKAFSGQL